MAAESDLDMPKARTCLAYYELHNPIAGTPKTLPTPRQRAHPLPLPPSPPDNIFAIISNIFQHGFENATCRRKRDEKRTEGEDEKKKKSLLLM